MLPKRSQPGASAGAESNRLKAQISAQEQQGSLAGLEIMGKKQGFSSKTHQQTRRICKPQCTPLCNIQVWGTPPPSFLMPWSGATSDPPKNHPPSILP